MGQDNLQKQVDYWNSVINPDNITTGELDLAEFDLEEGLCFYYTPAQKYAYSRMGDLNGKSVLELGCGLGMNAVMMARQGASVTAIDIAPKRVDWVNRLAQKYGYRNIKAVCMSAEDLSFPKENFDVVYSNEVLIHTNRSRCLKGCRDVLKTGGKAIFIESLNNPLLNLYRNTLGPGIFKDIAEHLTLKEIDSFRVYFEETKHKEFYFLSCMAFFWQFALKNKHIFTYTLGWLYKVDEIIFGLFPSMRVLAWMSCIECRK